MPLGGLPELRRLLAAERLCDRAPCMKMTAGRRLQRARHIATQPDALALHPWIGYRDRRQQRFGVGMFRRRIELTRRCRLDDAAEIHDGDAPADMFDDRQIMGDEEISESKLLLQVFQQIDDLGLDRDVKRRDWLVADDQLRFDRERACNPDALALAAREFVWITAHVLRLESDGFEKIGDPLLERLARLRQPMNGQGLADDGAHAHARVERGIRVLKDDLDVAAKRAKRVAIERAHILAIEADIARCRLDQAQHATARGRFAATGFADKPKRFARIDMKIDAADRMDGSGLTLQHPAADRKCLGEVADVEERRVHCSVSSARMHATLWPASMSRSRGCARRQSSMAKRQRGAKRQPAGGSISFGSVPAIVSSLSLRAAARSMRGIERIRPCV